MFLASSDWLAAFSTGCNSAGAFVLVSHLPSRPAPCSIPFHQVADRSLEARVLAEALMATMEEVFYDSLRTKQQLGYVVSSGDFREEGVK